jgi:RNA polymerase sigma factor (sigma-70 family)
VGDVGAFTSLVQRHEKEIRSFALRLSRSAQADDIAQETFIRAWRSAASFTGTGSYRSWLFRIAWNVFLTHRQRFHELDAFDAEVHGGSVSLDPNLVIDLERAFASLRPQERATAILCFGHGCSHSETAVALGLPLGTVKSIAARARKRLIDSLESDND